MKIHSLLASVALVALSACSGGGGSPSGPPAVPVFSPVGNFGGSLTDLISGNGVMALRIDSTGSGDFAVQFPEGSMNFSWKNSLGRISGSDFDLPTAFFTAAKSGATCPFSLHATMVTQSEMDGSTTLGDNTVGCGLRTTDSFRLLRSQLQSFAQQLPGVKVEQLVL